MSEKEESLEKKDDTRRLVDLQLHSQIPVLSYRMKNLEQIVKDKFDNGINRQLEKIFDRLNALQCDTHAGKIKGVAETTDIKIQALKETLDKNISRIWIGFFSVILLGIVFTLWMGRVAKVKQQNQGVYNISEQVNKVSQGG